MVGAVIGMIPEGMYLLVTVALALSTMRLTKNQVLLHDMRSVEALARVDVLCVDKTGTLTTNEMSVAEVVLPIGVSESEREAYTGLLASYVHTIGDNNITAKALRTYFPRKEQMETLSMQPFSSKTKFSEVVTETDTYRLGATEYILDETLLQHHQALPASLTSFFSIAGLVIFSQVFQVSNVDVGVASTYLLSFVGFLILFKICEPLNTYRKLVLGLCFAGFFICAYCFSSLFSISWISFECLLFVAVFTIAEESLMRNLSLLFEKIEYRHDRRKEK